MCSACALLSMCLFARVIAVILPSVMQRVMGTTLGLRIEVYTLGLPRLDNLWVVSRTLIRGVTTMRRLTYPVHVPVSVGLLMAASEAGRASTTGRAAGACCPRHCVAAGIDCSCQRDDGRVGFPHAGSIHRRSHLARGADKSRAHVSTSWHK